MKTSFLSICLLAQISVPAFAGVWAHYSFDADFTDVSGNGQDGTLTDVGTLGNTAITNVAADVKFGGGALDLSAERDFIAIPSKTFGTGTAYTVAFWAKKAPGDTGDPALWDMVIGQRGNTIFFISLNDASGTGGRQGLRWRSNTAAGGIRQADFGANDDTDWHHYAITADSAKNLSYYRDGVFQNTVVNVETGIILDTIGEAYNTSRDFDFHGQLDEMWIFDEALDSNAIAGLYTANDITAVLPDPRLHHRYDGDYTDSGTSGNDGTAAGGVSITSDAAEVVVGTGALELDGVYGSHVEVGLISFTASDPWSVSFWAQRAELGGAKGMVMGRRTNTTDFIWLNDNFDGFRFRSGNNTTFDFTASKDLNLHHYGLVADGAGNLDLYIDGQFSETLTGNTSFNVDSIGQGYTNALSVGFQGILDEVKIFNAALVAGQVEEIYDAEKPATSNLDVTSIQVFLLGGQSNADGRATPGSLPGPLQSAQSDIDFYYKVQGSPSVLTTLQPGLSETSEFGPEITLGRRLADLFGDGPETRTALIKYANGGTNLENHWAGGGDATTSGDGSEYLTFQQTVTDGLAALTAAYPNATIEICGMAWLQGESDINGGFHNDYEANLTAFIADLRATYGSDLSFVIIRLSDAQTSLDSGRLTIVQAAMDAVAAADPRTSVIDTDGFGMSGDNLHFDAAGQQSIGESSAEDFVYFKWMADTFSTSEINSGLATMAADGDRDGRSNKDEWIAGTLADDPLSFFEATIERPLPDSVEITYPDSSGRDFAVEVFDSILETWGELLAPQAGDGGSETRAFNSNDTENLYRVRAQLP